MSLYPAEIICQTEVDYNYIPNTVPGSFSINIFTQTYGIILNSNTGELFINSLVPTLFPSSLSLEITGPTPLTVSPITLFIVLYPINPIFYLTPTTPAVNIDVSYNAIPPNTYTYTHTLIGNTLPTGLSLDPTTGIISGTLNFFSSSPLVTYDVLVKNVLYGQSTTSFQLAVDTTPIFAYLESPYYISPGTFISITPTILSNAIGVYYFLDNTSPGLPNGLQLSITTGVISGTPANDAVLSNTYTIAAQTISGSPLGFYSTTLIIGVNIIPTFIYPDSPYVLQQGIYVEIVPEQIGTTTNTTPITNTTIEWTALPQTTQPYINNYFINSFNVDFMNSMSVVANNTDSAIIFGSPYNITNDAYRSTWSFNVDTFNWTNLLVTASNSIPLDYYPGELFSGQSMIYNSVGDFVFLFGGAETYLEYTFNIDSFELWEWNNQNNWIYTPTDNAWKQLVVSSPSQRAYASMCYDSAQNKAFLFGGVLHNVYPNKVFFNDTWYFDFNTLSWTQILISGLNPSKRSAASLAFHDTNEMLLFGGNDDTTLYDETWLLNTSAYTWTLLTPATSPSERTGGTMIFYPSNDPNNFFTQNVNMLFGGLGNNTLRTLYDTWIYINNLWLLINTLTLPSNTFNINPLAMAYQPPISPVITPTTGNLVYFSGSNKICLCFGNFQYIFTAFPKNATDMLVGVTYTITNVGNTVWTNYGAMSSTIGETFTCSIGPGTGTGTCVAYDWVPGISTPIQPIPNNIPENYVGPFSLMTAYNSDTNSLFYFTNKNESWLLDINTKLWSKFTPANSPGLLTQASIVYDSFNKQYTLFGGVNFDANIFVDDPYASPTATYTYNNVWNFKNNNWSQVYISSLKPTPRYNASIVFCPDKNLIILFGGTASRGGSTSSNFYLNDTWFYDVQLQSWTEMVPAINIIPSKRAFASFTYYASTANVIILFGGFSVNNNNVITNYNDTWLLDVNNNIWLQLTLDGDVNSPSSRYGGGLFDLSESVVTVYDPIYNGIIYVNAVLDTWTFCLANNGQPSQWKKLNVPLLNFFNKLGLANLVLVYDNVNEELFLALIGFENTNYVLTLGSQPQPPDVAYGVTYTQCTSTDDYTATPSLPYGLILNSSTGVISGTPTVLQAPLSYTITGTNFIGSNSTSLIISVVRAYTGSNMTSDLFEEQNPEYYMQHKATVLQYKKNQSPLTKKQLWAQAVTGNGQYAKRTWGTQSVNYTNPNFSNLPSTNGSSTTLLCPSEAIICKPTYNSDVPGKVMQLCLNTRLPFASNTTPRGYTLNGTKWPQTHWSPQRGGNGFPNFKAGSSTFFFR